MNKQTALLSDKLDWKRYLQPQNVHDCEECKRIDDFNSGIWEYNNSMLPRINELLEKMGYTRHKLEAPPKYYPIAVRKYNELIREEKFRMLKAIEFLAERGKLAIKDYKIVEGPVLADDIAEREEIERLVSKGVIDIREAAGVNHSPINCTCENKWDGKSERCIGEGVRVRWARQKTHHFLHPCVKPEVY